MQNANLSQEGSEEQGSRIPDTPPRQSKPEAASESTIERAAQRLDWTIAFGARYNAPRGLDETANQRPRLDRPRAALMSWPRSSRAKGAWLRLISGVCLASVLVAAAGTGLFFLTRPSGERATAESAAATKAPEDGSEAASLIRGRAVPPPAGAAQSATLAEQALAPAAPERDAKLTVDPTLSPLGGPKPNVATTLPSKMSEGTSTVASPAPGNQPAVPALSAADIAELLARGDWLFATGDVTSARLLYERAAAAGEARAAVMLGQTFDPAYLDFAHLRGLQRDPGTAVFWYRRARDLGATGVASRLKRLEAKEGRN
jgi:hypothetical protein